MTRARPWMMAPLLGLLAGLGGGLVALPVAAQEEATVTEAPAGPPALSPRPRPRPPEIGGDVLTDEAGLPVAAPAPVEPDAGAAANPDPVDPASVAAPPEETAAARIPRDPTKGAVTNLPIPRYVSLKGGEGNARRGPGLTHRIDWVFTTAGMPLRITAEHENWRRVEDAEGMGGWVHYSLLSGVRSVLVTVDMAEFYTRPDAKSGVQFQAETGVIGRLLECEPDWCRVNVQGEKGWVLKTSLWGVDPGEVVQ